MPAGDSENDPRYLGIYRNVTVPLGCEEVPDPAVGLSVEDLTNWLTAHPGLAVTEPAPVSVGGLSGLVMDVSLDGSWSGTCPWSGGRPGVGHIIGAGPSSLTHVILPSIEERLYLPEFDDGNIAIEVGPEGMSLERYLEAVSPIIESLVFESD